MSADLLSERPLFGGAISTTFPLRFQDVSNIRQVPDHQEVFVDPARDESLVFELLDYKHDVGDEGSAVWFIQDLAIEQDGEGFTVYLANIRLKEVGTDVLITAYEPIVINPLSESASAVGAGLAIPATQSGFMPMVEIFKLAVTNFKANDWGLFSPSV
ncbi:hypothetical protein GOBAR_DD07986 [Gossypium barbadense]|nr:hypothetical protein GOBAR_DD07986 [Gossypium barbadense]